jgi:hypothetical protein
MALFMGEWFMHFCQKAELEKFRSFLDFLNWRMPGTHA